MIFVLIIMLAIITSIIFIAKGYDIRLIDISVDTFEIYTIYYNHKSWVRSLFSMSLLDTLDDNLNIVVYLEVDVLFFKFRPLKKIV